MLERTAWKKAVYTITFYLQFLWVAGYLKHSNGTPKLNTHKYTNYNIIEIYINRLKYYDADFHSDELLDTNVRSTFILEKKAKSCDKEKFFPPRWSN